MTLGILEDHHLEHVPGTSLLADRRSARSERLEDAPSSSNLKHGTGPFSHIVLQPQPTDDPQDPLNWPVWKKELLFWTLMFAAGLVGAIGPLMAPGYAFVAKQWNVSVDAVASSNGALLLGLGCFMFVQSAFAVKYGKRPIFIFSMAVLFFCSIWSAVSKGLTSFIASRTFQGFGMAAYEALVTATIGDIYFVHERGVRVAIWGFALIGGINITPIVNGYVISGPLGWRWCFWLISIMFGISFITVILFVPETVYDRAVDTEGDANVAIDASVKGTSLPSASKAAKAATAAGSPRSEWHDDVEKDKGTLPQHHEHAGRNDNAVVSTLSHGGGNDKPTSGNGRQRKPKTFVEELKPWSGYKAPVSLWRTVLRPFPFLLSPAVLWAVLAYGLTTAWLVIASVLTSIVFGGPPYFFTTSQVGLVSIGPLIASIIGAFVSGPLCDYVGVWFAKRNNGVFEPESRLLLLIFMLLFEVFGYMGWALMQGSGQRWIGPVVMYSFINFGQGVGSTAIVTYLIDVHRKNAPECFAIINFVKNIITYGFTRFVNSWVETHGVRNSFATLSGIVAVFILPSLPMYIFGKRCRSFVARHPRLFMDD